MLDPPNSLYPPYAGIGGEFWNSGWDWIGGTWRDRYRANPGGWASHQYVFDIVDSVLASGVSDRLLVTTSMHDLVVASAEAKAGEYETIKVISPANYALFFGHMGLAFASQRGRRQEIRQYLIEDAVDVFWEMVEEKFGISPAVR